MSRQRVREVDVGQGELGGRGPVSPRALDRPLCPILRHITSFASFVRAALYQFFIIVRNTARSKVYDFCVAQDGRRAAQPRTAPAPECTLWERGWAGI